MMSKSRSTVSICVQTKALIRILKPRYGTSDHEVIKQALSLLCHIDNILNRDDVSGLDFPKCDSLASKPETNQP